MTQSAPQVPAQARAVQYTVGWRLAASAWTEEGRSVGGHPDTGTHTTQWAILYSEPLVQHGGRVTSPWRLRMVTLQVTRQDDCMTVKHDGSMLVQ